MADPNGGFSLIDILNQLWILVLGLVGVVYRMFVKKHEVLEERLAAIESSAVTRIEAKETNSYLQSQLAKIFDKLEDLKTLIYERTDGEVKK